MPAARFTTSWASQAGDHVLRRAETSKEPCQITLELPQGTAGFSLLSSARICELYSVVGAELSYICSIKGVAVVLPAAEGSPQQENQQQPSQQQQQQQQHLQGVKLWRVEHRWTSHSDAPPTAMLRLLSLQQKDALFMQCLHLLPASAAQGSSGTSDQQCEAVDTGEEQAGSAAATAETPAAAGSMSQIDDVRRMLSQLVAAEKSGGSGGDAGGVQQPHDPKRALLAAIAKSVLQQQPRHQHAFSGGVEMVQLPAAPADGEPAAAAVAPESPQDLQSHQQHEARPTGHQGQLSEVLGTVQRLEERVARIEVACLEMNSLLQQLVGAAKFGV
ncbi:hypothetical protein D9Q98_002827 [Chlorella vulgaris]|uniref:Uncharacterized protein n=1 Tax=Chlorella vulgaris TaxID=3077 RepID=A0A9D4YZ77_CHLVU|nr:hypothetical protein D9Q98_002827 [Chlorella vulgaris]